MIQKLYDQKENRLLYFNHQSTPEKWDELWSKTNNEYFDSEPGCRFWIRKTKKYLPENSLILEGGCGLGAMVYALNKNNFEVIGLDNAPNIVNRLNLNWPHLKIIKGDVKNLDFEDNFFDGYWSFGVIEHFQDGYKQIVNEMARVIRKNGYLFITFPSMNGLRIAKSYSNKYLSLERDKFQKDTFWQYALNPERVIEELNKVGFEVIEDSNLGICYGISDELNILKNIYNYFEKSYPKIIIALDKLIDPILGYYYGHIKFLILKKIT